jgi:hypothetical protein
MKHAMQKREHGQDFARPGFKLSPVAAGCAVLVLSLTGIAHAQQTAENTVVVTGIRKGIEDAISVKKIPIPSSKRFLLKISANCPIPASLNRLPACQVYPRNV